MTQETVEQQDTSIVEQQAQDTAQSEDTSVEVSESEADTDRIEQDDEATTLELVLWALEELSGELVDKLSGTLNALNEPLEEDRAAKAGEAQTLRQAHESLQHRAAAQQRVLAAEMDRAIASGQDAAAEEKREQIAELEKNLHDIQTQASACDRRVQELEAEQKQNYLTVFESYPEIRESTAAVAIALAKLLDKVWSSITRFEAESGLPLEGIRVEILLAAVSEIRAQRERDDLAVRTSTPQLTAPHET